MYYLSPKATNGAASSLFGGVGEISSCCSFGHQPLREVAEL